MRYSILLLFFYTSISFGQAVTLRQKINIAAAKIEQKVIDWRRDFHQHPELGNHEVRTAQIIAEHLEALGMEVQTGVAHTGVVGVLTGGGPGP
ncbi:MAG TPA: amidohydrolase, partial [Ferruginibacter sp.]|nr:amidohydrolase [Ferruginibacter sp.]